MVNLEKKTDFLQLEAGAVNFGEGVTVGVRAEDERFRFGPVAGVRKIRLDLRTRSGPRSTGAYIWAPNDERSPTTPIPGPEVLTCSHRLEKDPPSSATLTSKLCTEIIVYLL